MEEDINNIAEKNRDLTRAASDCRGLKQTAHHSVGNSENCSQTETACLINEPELS